jgi:putative NIF3 family GTP cyclohydrolase 1 type 2
MRTSDLYEKLEKDFDLDSCKDADIKCWSGMEFNQYVSELFRKRYMGLYIDNSTEIETVFTAVFPSDKVLNHILATGVTDALLFTHHPMTWDIRIPEVFSYINNESLDQLKKGRISIYVLHTPLDKNGQYSTSVNFAKAIGVRQESEFCKYFDVVNVGIIGSTDYKTVNELVEHIKSVVAHDVRLWNYGTKDIKNGKVALAAGGGNEIFVLEEVLNFGINTYITGVTVKNDFSKKSHEFAEKNKINLIGTTHYSTEKFACIAMCGYFEGLGLTCEFIEDIPIIEDI